MTEHEYCLVAVLVPATTTIDTIDAHLTAPMRVLTPGVFDHYRLGGRFTGAWDPGYDPSVDPANWRPCSTCDPAEASTGRVCSGCADAAERGRPAGTVLADPGDWAAHPGDIVALTRLLDPDWRYPALPEGAAGQHYRFSTPRVYTDEHAMAWLGGPDNGETPHGLLRVWESLVAGHRQHPPAAAPFDPADWAVAVVAARWSPDEVKATLPVIGSVVLITDPAWAEGDAGPDQLYVVSDDFGAPYYQLVRLGGYGPLVPGHALTEVDPDRIRLDPARDGAAPYPSRPVTADS
jgi:hypothetical protein